MGRGMRTLFFTLALAFTFTAPLRVAVAEHPCKDKCREHAKACKSQCKAQHPYGGTSREQCINRCEATEHKCRAHCIDKYK